MFDGLAAAHPTHHCTCHRRSCHRYHQTHAISWRTSSILKAASPRPGCGLWHTLSCGRTCTFRVHSDSSQQRFQTSISSFITKDLISHLPRKLRQVRTTGQDFWTTAGRRSSESRRLAGDIQGHSGQPSVGLDTKVPNGGVQQGRCPDDFLGQL
jgi:hypothetical protein